MIIHKMSLGDILTLRKSPFGAKAAALGHKLSKMVVSANKP